MSSILRTLVKWCFFSLVGVAAIVAAVLAFVLFAVDPNWLKPEIERQLSKQGINLSIENDISWQFYPNFGLQVADIVLMDEQGKTEVFNTGQAGFSLAIAPLLQRKIEVVAVNLVDTEVFYVVHADGSSNWDFLSKNKDSADKTRNSDTKGSSGVSLSVDQIKIDNAAIFIDDQKANTTSKLSKINADVRNVNISGEQSGISLSGIAKILEFPELAFELNTLVRLDQQKNALSFTDARFILSENNQTIASLGADGHMVLDTLTLESQLSFESDRPRALAHIFGLKIPSEVPNNALQSAGLSTNFSANFSNNLEIAAEALAISLDKFRLEGKAALTSVSEKPLPKIELQLTSPKLDINQFYKPKSNENKTEAVSLSVATATATATATEDDSTTTLPVDLIKAFSSDLDVSIGKLVYEKVELHELNVKMASHNGVFKAEKVEAKIQEGRFLFSGDLNAQKKSPQLNAAIQTENINIGYLLENLFDITHLKGDLNSDLTLRSNGLTTGELQNNLQASINVNSKELRLVPIDLVKNVCEVVAFVERKPLQERQWKAYTELSPVKIDAKLSGEKIAVDKISAKVEKFNALASGRFNLSNLSFDFPIELSLADFAAELEGCNFISDEWRKKSFPLRCKGEVSTIDVKTCQPNYALIREKWKNKLEEKVDAEKERVKERVEENIKDKLKDKIGDKVDEKELERLKDIFKRK